MLPIGDETTLVVEDEDALRKLIVTTLRRAGYITLEAHQGEEALAICRTYPELIDLLITDIVMPGMNGWELAGKITSHSSDTKVLYISGYTENVIFLQGILDRQAPFLQKPFTLDRLLHKVREVLDGQPPGD